MAIVIFIVVALIVLLIVGFFISNAVKVKAMLKEFDDGSVIVAGAKGKGKDLLFQYVINHRKNDEYYSNISYGHKYHNVKLKDMCVGDNTYINFIRGDIEKSEHKFIENADFFISDAGVHLPSFMDSTLYKQYPSLPIFYALSRHLYNANVHTNTQVFSKLWKALREQADFYIICNKTIHFFGFHITFVTCYDKLSSAESGLRPIKTRIANKYSKAEVDKFKSMNGNITTCFVIQHTKSLNYDTRAFERICLKGKRK